ncbi:MAG: NAD(P)H-dependent oxidoreductase [Alteromonadaceae bacterium]|nr:NAD(P)H-dependent oxidoreductase [Alteromonadaceae bacterium]
MNTILQINSSSRYNDSITRQVAELVVNNLSKDSSTIISRDLAKGLPFIDEQWIGANFTAPEDRTDEHKATLSFSDLLVNELQQAEHIVIASPIYNFSLPAALKAWVDLIARARLTFQYTANGPEGLLKNKKAYIVIASGGVPVGSSMDFSSPYLKHVLAFVGITDVTIIDANNIDLTSDQVANLVAKQLNS